MIIKSGNAHDSMFRALFSEPEAAARLFSEQMPKSLFSLLKTEPPQLIPGSFIDDNLAEHRTDLLYRALLKTGESAYIYLLVEHKSVNDPLTPLQLLRYMCNIWSRRTAGKSKAPLTPIIPVVFYHGARPWSAAATFHGMFPTLDRELQPLTAQFAYVLIDLGKIDDDKLSRDLRQRAYLAALKYNTRHDMKDMGLGRVATLFADLSAVDIKRILLYILTQHQGIGRNDLNRALLEHAPRRKDEIMNVFLKEIEDEGKAKWMAVGKTEGKAETLLKQLPLRFGAVPKDIEQRIREANAETLDRWSMRIFDAKTLKDVFAD